MGSSQSLSRDGQLLEPTQKQAFVHLGISTCMCRQSGRQRLKPSWLCDVAAALESRHPNFDWDRCFGRNKRRADWIACAIGLANRLLGAELRDVPVENRANSLPRWLISSVLKQWSTPYPPNLPSFASQLKGSWWRADVLTAVRQRWPNPIQATVDGNGSFDNTTRLPFQLRDCIARTVKLCLPLHSFARH